MTTPLEEELRTLIRSEGPISLARYIALCLGHPRHGYYATRDPFGPAGDFVTSPEISQMFGELIGLWAAHAWTEAGAPARVGLVELGPGRGTLMKDALRAVRRAAPAFAGALTVHLVETSPTLRALQEEAISPTGAEWHDGIETLPDGPLIILANEFFDALPIRQFVRAGEAWRERQVGLEGNRLVFGLSPEPLAGDILPAAPEGAVLEIGEAAAAIAASLARRVSREGGAALIIDYGHTQSAFGDTLQAVRAHRFVDPLEAPGEADLTAHVDFAALARSVEAEGARVSLLASQADFLEALGIRERAAALKARAGAAQAAAVDAALGRLTDRADRGMGSLFKVLAF